MTPKEKAEKLVLKYLRLQEIGSTNWFHIILAKQCALIAVDELIKSWDEDLYINCGASLFWQEVKEEIEKL
jgi:hypothetical protein